MTKKPIRALRAIRNISRLIVTEKDRNRLLRGATDILVETGGYASALCVCIDDDRQPDIVAHRTASTESTREAEDAIRMNGLTACMKQALETNKLVVVDSDRALCTECPLGSYYPDKQRMATTLLHDGRTYGVLVVVAPEGVTLDAEEIDLVEEISGDLGFALHGIEQAEKLVSERAMTETAINAMSDTFFLFNPHTGRALQWNRAFRALSGYTDEEIAKLPAPVSYYDADDLERAGAALEKATREGKASLTLDLVTKTGQRIPTAYAATAVPGPREGETLVIAIGRDISELNRMQMQIVQSDRLASMGMLAAGVAHEINNPLSYVLYNLEILTEDIAQSLDKDTLKRAEDAFAGTKRIRDIVRNLSTFSRVEKDALGAVDLTKVMEASLDMSFNELKYKARLVREYGTNLPTIVANEGRLSQVFLNLVINAAHAIDEGDAENNEIRVSTWREGDTVCAEVCDTGKGIQPDHLEKVFEPFFTTKEIGTGSGIGLAISKSIVESYNGEIEVESKRGKGTSFIVRFPIGVDRAVATEPPQVMENPSEVRGRILIVEDEEALRLALVDILGDRHLTENASGGAAAKRILEKDQNFDVILCDMMMPDVSGMDLHEWLTREHPRLAKQFVFITGGAFTPRAQEYLDTVETPHVKKPFAVAALRKMVAKFVRNAKSDGATV